MVALWSWTHLVAMKNPHDFEKSKLCYSEILVFDAPLDIAFFFFKWPQENSWQEAKLEAFREDWGVKSRSVFG